MNENIKTYCPYCGIELDIIHDNEDLFSSNLHHIEGRCCNCENYFNWVRNTSINQNYSVYAFSQSSFVGKYVRPKKDIITEHFNTTFCSNETYKIVDKLNKGDGVVYKLQSSDGYIRYIARHMIGKTFEVVT